MRLRALVPWTIFLLYGTSERCRWLLYDPPNLSVFIKIFVTKYVNWTSKKIIIYWNFPKEQDKVVTPHQTMIKTEKSHSHPKIQKEYSLIKEHVCPMFFSFLSLLEILNFPQVIKSFQEQCYTEPPFSSSLNC